MGCCHAGGGGVEMSWGQVSPMFTSTFPSADQLLDQSWNAWLVIWNVSVRRPLFYPLPTPGLVEPAGEAVEKRGRGGAEARCE